MNLLVNKKIRHSYEVLETFEAGIKLSGSEVKSLRKKHGSIKEAYIKGDKELFLQNCHIPPFQPGHLAYENIDTYTARKILLNKKEISYLKGKQKEKGLSLAPVRIYEKGSLIKIEIALVRGKKLHDKRNDMKNRTSKREAERAIKNTY